MTRLYFTSAEDILITLPGYTNTGRMAFHASDRRMKECLFPTYILSSRLNPSTILTLGRLQPIAFSREGQIFHNTSKFSLHYTFDLSRPFYLTYGISRSAQ